MRKGWGVKWVLSSAGNSSQMRSSKTISPAGFVAAGESTNDEEQTDREDESWHRSEKGEGARDLEILESFFSPRKRRGSDLDDERRQTWRRKKESEQDGEKDERKTHQGLANLDEGPRLAHSSAGRSDKEGEAGIDEEDVEIALARTEAEEDHDENHPARETPSQGAVLSRAAEGAPSKGQERDPGKSVEGEVGEEIIERLPMSQFSLSPVDVLLKKEFVQVA